jgi:hypothetical protein
VGDNNGNFFNGALDEVAIFNKSLTPAQIGDLLAAASTGIPSVALTAPADGSTLNGSSNITLRASVTTNGNRTIEGVQFYDTTPTVGRSQRASLQFCMGRHAGRKLFDFCPSHV